MADGVAPSTPPQASVDSGVLKSSCFGKHAEGLDYVVVLPPGFDKTEKLPVLLNLHGSSDSAQALAAYKPGFEGFWASGLLPRCVVATFSTINGVGMYTDYHDGSMLYHKFFMGEWLPFLRSSYGVSPERSHTWLVGTSMGGLGSLRLGLTHPDVFAGLAALVPAIDPVFEPAELQPRNLFMRGDFDYKEFGAAKPPHGTVAAETEAMFGAVDHKSWDADLYQAYNPASIVRANAQTIRERKLKIYIDAADEDFFNFHEGAEFLHQALWKHRIPHEYRLNTEADHMGSTMGPRVLASVTWLGTMMRRAMDPPSLEPTPGQKLYLDWLAENEVFFPPSDLKPPEGAEHLGDDSDVFKQWLRGRLPRHLSDHFDHCAGWDRLPEATVNRARRL